MTLTVEQISQLSPAEVDQLFRQASAGPIPDGDSDGTAIFWPGSPTERFTQRLVHTLAWRGKVVDARAQLLRNKITPLGIRAIAADVYLGTSWFDGATCITVDYSKRSRIAGFIRNEIRLVAPDLYLGVVYLNRLRSIYFTLQFPSPPVLRQAAHARPLHPAASSAQPHID